MDHKQTPKQYATEQRRELFESQTGNSEIAMKAHFAQQFGHVAIRHANKEISDEDLNRFHDLYVDKLSKHTLIEDRKALSRDFDAWVDAMWPAALADIYDAKLELEADSLPVYVSVERMSEMTARSDDELLHANLELTQKLSEVTAENSRFMNQLVGMSQDLRSTKGKLQRLQLAYDNLVITGVVEESDDLHSHSSVVS